MSVTVSFNVDKFQRSMSRKRKALVERRIPRALGVAAEYAKDAIKQRTQKGKGVRDGKTYRMSGYTQSYAKFRAKHGRQTARVDFNYSGRMWSGLRWKRHDDREARIFFTRREAGKAAGNHARRPFFDLSAKEEARVIKIIEKELRGIF